MNDRANLIAFLGVLVTIVILTIIAATTGRPDAQIISAVLTGLIGVLGTFRPRSAGATTVENVENATVTADGK